MDIATPTWSSSCCQQHNLFLLAFSDQLESYCSSICHRVRWLFIRWVLRLGTRVSFIRKKTRRLKNIQTTLSSGRDIIATHKCRTCAEGVLMRTMAACSVGATPWNRRILKKKMTLKAAEPSSYSFIRLGHISDSKASNLRWKRSAIASAPSYRNVSLDGGRESTSVS